VNGDKDPKVVITGMGAITPLGNDVETFWSNLCAGKSGVTQITRFRSNDDSVAGISEPGLVECNPALDDITYNAVGAGTVPGMPWVNRPTFQQVVSYPAHR